MKCMEHHSSAVCRIVYEVPYQCDEELIRMCVREVMRHEQLHGGVTVVFVSGLKMKSMNQRFRGVDSVTDILSFPSQQDTQSALYLGEIVLCPQGFRIEKGKSEEWEVLHLVAHGIFHLLGRHHEHEDDGYKEIHNDEVAIIDRVLTSRSN